ncbi:hypothetical protein K9N50_10770 [bacterium]|nr:hypothetical protein [bacterium]
MIIDSKLVLSDAQAITTSTASDNEIDFGAASLDIGQGNPIYLEVWLDTAFDTSVNTLTISLKDSPDGTTYTERMVVLPATATSSLLTAGKLQKVALPYNLARYIELYYTCSAALTSGVINAFLTIG